MYRKNTAGQNLGFVLINATTGGALTGATVTAYRSIDGAAQASATGSVTELGHGQYNFAPSQADTNGNQISYLFTAASAVPAEKTIVTTAADPTNGTSLGLTNLDAAISTRSTYAGGAVASVTGNVGGNVLGSVAGSVAAVTGNVGGSVASVTGNVGGNLAGSVGSVTGNVGGSVGSVAGNVIGSVGSVASAVTISLSQTGFTPRNLGSVADNQLTIGDALVAAICAAAGKESVSGTTYTVQTPSTGTTIRSFTLDSGTSPSTRS